MDEDLMDMEDISDTTEDKYSVEMTSLIQELVKDGYEKYQVHDKVRFILKLHEIPKLETQGMRYYFMKGLELPDYQGPYGMIYSD